MMNPVPFIEVFNIHTPEGKLDVHRFPSGSSMLQCTIGDRIITAELSVLRGYGISVDDANDPADGAFSLPKENFDSEEAAVRRLEEALRDANERAAVAEAAA